MISHATIIGRSHRLMQQNCHDFAITGTPAPDCVFGLVLDGCGSKHREETGTYPSHNEVGAKLLGQFTGVYLATQLPHHDLDKIFFVNLYSICCHYLQNLIALLPTTNPILQNRSPLALQRWLNIRPKNMAYLKTMAPLPFGGKRNQQ